MLTQVAATNITDCFSTTMQSYIDNIINLIQHMGNSGELDAQAKAKLLDHVDITSLLEKMCKTFKTTTSISNYIKQEKGFVEPQVHTLPSDEAIYFIPLMDILKIIVNKLVQKNASAFFDTPYYDFLKDKFGEDMIYIKLYLDEFLVVNPIGSARGNKNYKFVGIYLQLMNQLDNSRLSSVYLYAVFPYKYVEEFGYSVVLQGLVSELNDLFYTGIICDDGKIRKCMAVFWCGDNLSQHHISGLQRSFALGYICRYCDYKVTDGNTAVGKKRTYASLLKNVENLQCGTPTEGQLYVYNNVF